MPNPTTSSIETPRLYVDHIMLSYWEATSKASWEINERKSGEGEDEISMWAWSKHDVVSITGNINCMACSLPRWLLHQILLELILQCRVSCKKREWKMGSLMVSGRTGSIRVCPLYSPIAVPNDRMCVKIYLPGSSFIFHNLCARINNREKLGSNSVI